MINCDSCIDKIFDLQLEALGFTRIAIHDRSVWKPKGNGQLGTEFEIALDSWVTGKKVILPLTLLGQTIITTKELYGGSTENCLRDDIFCFRVFTCGDNMSIQRAFLPNAWCQIDFLVQNAKDEIDRKLIKELTIYAKGVESLSASGRVDEARNNFGILKQKLRNVDCDCCEKRK